MTYKQLSLSREVANLQKMRSVGERWVNTLKESIKTDSDAEYLMREQSKLSSINNRLQQAKVALEVYKLKRNENRT